MERSLARAWDDAAKDWIAWATAPGHDSYWAFHRDRFLEIVPAPGRLTLDIGCGEGRVGRDLAARGHRVIGVDASATVVRALREHPDSGDALVGDAARLPIADAVADLAVGFMSFQDFDRLDLAVAEVARVLRPGGRVHLAVVHPLNSAGEWRPVGDGPDADSTFVIERDYVTPRRYAVEGDRDGLAMTFHGVHRPLSAYTEMLTEHGFAIDRLVEVADPDPASKWSRVPLFLHLVARC